MSPADPVQPTERRCWPRSEEELLITCRDRSQMHATYFTRSLAGGGLMFEASEPITPGTCLEIELYAPVDCEKRTLRFMCIVARARWTSEIPEAFASDGSNRHRIGVAFDEIDPQDQACLDEYVKKRLMMANTERVA